MILKMTDSEILEKVKENPSLFMTNIMLLPGVKLEVVSKKFTEEQKHNILNRSISLTGFKEHNRIPFIKMIRDVFNISLREANDLSIELVNNRYPSVVEFHLRKYAYEEEIWEKLSLI